MNPAKTLLARNIFGYCVVIPLLLFIAVPLFMVGNSPGDFGFLNLKVLLLAGLIWGVAGALLLLLVSLMFVRMQKTDLVLHGLRFLFWWVLIAGFLLPVSVSAGMVDASTAQINVVNLLLTAVLSVVLTWFATIEARLYVFTFAAVLCLVSLGSSIYAIAQSDIGRSSTNMAATLPAAELSNTRNVLVISLDGLQGHIAAKILKQDADVAEAFKDFTLFENALSQSPATEASMVGELFGVRDYKALGNSIEEVKDALYQGGVAQQIPLLREADAYQKRYPFGACLLYTSDAADEHRDV